jgi:long-subunit fatty acid transport protein
MSYPRSLLALALASIPSVAHAGGLFAGDNGAAAQQRAGAYVARADDGSALAINPAGLMKLRGFTLSGSLNVLGYHIDYDAAGVYEPFTRQDPADQEPAFVGQERPGVSDSTVSPVPLLVLSYGAERWAAALGVFAPQGAPNREFSREVRLADGTLAPAPQRYDILDQKPVVVMPSLGAAFRVHPTLDVGLRATWGFGIVDAKVDLWGVDKASSFDRLDDSDYDALFDLHVTDSFVPSMGLGLLWRPLPSLEIGAAWQSAQKLSMKGTGTAALGPGLGFGGLPAIVRPPEDQFAFCAGGGREGSLKSCLELTVPQTVQAGARWIFHDGAGGELADVEIDVKWEQWSKASNIDVTVDGDVWVGENKLNTLQVLRVQHGFEDVFSVRLGGQYRLPVGAHHLAIRGGAAYDTAAAPESWSRVDLDGAAHLSLMTGVSFDAGSWTAELGGGVILSPARDVPQADYMTARPVGERTQPDPGQPIFDAGGQRYYPINGGHYESGYWILSLGGSYRF